MNERLKKIRKDKKLTQEEFSAKLGLSRNFIAQTETGAKIPSDRTIKDICREFNVNEDWLRNGTEPMYIELSRDEQIAGFIGSVLSTEKETFKKRLIRVLSQLNEDEWEFLEQKARELVGYEAEKES